MIRPWQKDVTAPDVTALLARVQSVRETSRAYRRARGLPVWEPPCRGADGTLRGWRTWQLDDSEPGSVRLRSFNGAPDNLWPRGVLVARCLWERDHTVDGCCTCGIYAFADARTLLREVLNEQVTTEQIVVGEIAGWGRASLHDRGWRAELAMIRALWTRGLSPTVNCELGTFHEVSVEPLDELLIQIEEDRDAHR
jgi:hypothetical protein